MKKIDSEKRIKHVLTRSSCLLDKGVFVKDLSRLNRNLKDVIIIDVFPNPTQEQFSLLFSLSLCD